METLKSIIQNPWPWWIGGPLIGIVAVVLFISERKQLGISSSYQFICGKIWPFSNAYLKQDSRTFRWQSTFVLGMVAGGFILVALATNEAGVAISQGAKGHLAAVGINDFSSLVPADLYNFNSTGVVWLLIGGLFTGFGARYANGCTAGHAITGCAQLAPSSLIATACFFAGGLGATHLIVPFIFL